MEPINIDDLKANPKNPRRISEHDYKALLTSIKTFGDLSGIVKNNRTGQLVGGHQRIQAFKELGGQPVITERYPQPNSKGTTAIGYVILEDEKFGYREVDWDADFEMQANVAANKIQGEFDNDLLAQIVYETSQLENGTELNELMGFTEKEAQKLIDSVAGSGEENEDENDDPDKIDNMDFAVTREQREVIDEAIGHIKATREMAAEKNSSMNGNALYYMARDYLDRLHGLVQDQPQQPAVVVAVGDRLDETPTAQ